MYQRYALDGTALRLGVFVGNDVGDLFKGEGVVAPKGLLGLDTNTGLVDVALTTDENGDILKKSPMKIGKLLMKNGDSEAWAREISGKLSAMVAKYKGSELEFAVTTDDIYDVYENGPRSCMSGNESVSCYAGDDTAIAFAKIDDRIVARCVICTNEDVGLGRLIIYGNSDLLKPLLEEAGYGEKLTSLAGCNLLHLENSRGEVLAPYLDTSDQYDVDHFNSSLKIVSCGSHDAQNTDGLLESGYSCESCSDHVHEDYCFHTDDGLFCETCFDDSYVFLDCEVYHKDDVCFSHRDGEWYTNEDCVYLEHLNDYVHIDDAVFSEYLSEYILGDDAHHSDINDEYYLEEDVHWGYADDTWICKDDAIEALVDPDGTTVYTIEDNTTNMKSGRVHDDFVDLFEEHEEEEDV